MTLKNEQENYFAFIISQEGGIELIQWFKTRREAKQTAKEWKALEADKNRKKDIWFGKRLLR